MFKRFWNKLNEYIHQYISEKLFIIFLQNHKSYIKVIDILDETEKQINLDGILVGLNANWIYNICIQLSKKEILEASIFKIFLCMRILFMMLTLILL